MSARSRAEARLARGGSGVTGRRAWEPVRGVAGRARPLPRPRSIPGDGLHVHSGAIRELKLHAPARPAPNAPLLIRLVRAPFALERAGFTKRRLLEPFPTHAIAHRPEPRPRPFRRVYPCGDPEPTW